MSKTVKSGKRATGRTIAVFLIIAVVLIVLGGIISMLITGKYTTNTYEIDEAFGDISMTTSTADIKFALSDDGKCKVECYEKENAKHSVTVENDALTVKINKSFNFGFNFGSPKITVYLPKTEYNALSIIESTGNIEIPKNFSFGNVDISSSTGNVDFGASASKSVKIKTTTGSIGVENISADALDLAVTTGKVNVSGVTCRDGITVGVSTGRANLSDISCKSVISSGTTGSISLNNVVAANKFSVERSTGNVEFSGCDAAEIYVNTTTGNVSGSFLTSKVFTADTKTGSVDIPKTTTGGKCEISTSTGNINIQIV